MQADKYIPVKYLDINFKKRDYIWSMSSFHYHNSYEIYYLAGGSRTILIKDKIYELQPNDVMLFLPEVFHRTTGNVGHERFNIEFTDDVLCHYFTPYTKAKLLECFKQNFLRLNKEEASEFLHLFNLLKQEYEEGGMFYITLANILKLLNCAAERQYCKNVSSAGQKLSKGAMKLTPVISYITQNYATISSINEIADSCYINKSYMCRLFKKELGITITDYLNNTRVQQACELITSTDNTLTDIAMQCGFGTAPYFSFIFKKIMGCTPSKFRITHKNSQH